MRYEAGVQAGIRRYGVEFADAGLFHHPSAAGIGRAYQARGGAAAHRAQALRRTLLHLLDAGTQLVLPVVLLLSLGMAAYLDADTPATWLGSFQDGWLTTGHLIVPLTFFAIALTNRRYGAGYAWAQMILAWSAAIAIAVMAGAPLAELAGHGLPPVERMLAYGGGLIAGQAISILIFDLTRGPRWWVAPFLATLWGGLIFCLIALPVAYAGVADWLARTGLYSEVMVASAVLLLIPYWFLRRVLPPPSGFGGY